MKIFFVVAVCFFVAVQALNEKQKETITKLYAGCVASTGVDEALIKKLRAGEEVSDEKVKKYLGCMFTKLNFINSDRDLQVEVITSKIPADYNHAEAVKVINECKLVKGGNLEDACFEAYKCFLKKSNSKKPIIIF